MVGNTFELGEIDTSAAYRLARYVVIPRLKAEVFPTKGSEPFSLRDDIYAILKDEVAKGTVTQEQLDTTCQIKPNGGNPSLASKTRYFVLILLKHAGEIMSSDTRGMFILTDAAAIEEEEEEEEEEGGAVSGSIYAYTFPSLNGSMIKVGKASGNVEDRINQQLGTANPESPNLLNSWPVNDKDNVEKAIHSILKARGKWVIAPRATEWFRTSVEEVEAIIKFINKS